MPASTQPAYSQDFRTVYESSFADVSRWVRALGGPEADIDDLVQDVFLVVHRRLIDFDGINLPGWLYQITRRRVRDFRRLLWVKNTLLHHEPLSEELKDDGPWPSDEVETTEKRALLQRSLRQLNESERAALILFEIDNYSGREIAEVQGVPVNTVWARIHRARSKLKAALTRYDGRE